MSVVSVNQKKTAELVQHLVMSVASTNQITSKTGATTSDECGKYQPDNQQNRSNV